MRVIEIPDCLLTRDTALLYGGFDKIYDPTITYDKDTIIYKCLEPVEFKKSIPPSTELKDILVQIQPTLSNKTILEIYDDYIQRNPQQIHTITVITATTGNDCLRTCIQSVQSQTIIGLTHMIVIDGKEYENSARVIINEFQDRRRIQVLVLSDNTGKGGWNGHRIYGSVPYLVSSDYVAFLDDDNIYRPDHLYSLLSSITTSPVPAHGAFSLRTVFDEHETCLDNCESLGTIRHSVLSTDDYFIDTSCMLIERQKAIHYGSMWNKPFRSGGEEADRCFSRALIENCVMVPTWKSTLQYKVSNTPNSVSMSFFKHHWENGLDVSLPTVYVYHFNPEATRRLFERPTNPHEEWQVTQLYWSFDDFNLINGFEAKHIPIGATLLIHMCQPETLPLELFKHRTDTRRIVYTLESPNIRHEQQWSTQFLNTYFTDIITYWTPLLRTQHNSVYFPHNTHFHINELEPVNYIEPRRSVCMVLENRELDGSFTINGTEIKCLDRLRHHYIKGLDEVDVYGLGWKEDITRPNVNVKWNQHRSCHHESAVDIYKLYTFVVVIENCDADGYVSEKIYDVLEAGAIPIYYGNNNGLIPEDCYIDLRQFTNSYQLNEYLKTVDVIKVQACIMVKRQDILGRVDSWSYRTLLKKLICK